MTDARSADGTAMDGTTVLVGKLFRVRRGRGRRFEKEQPKEPEKRPAKIALQLALAYRIQGAIEAGEIKDHAAAARRLGLTRARVSQLLDLTLLAPELQEQVVFLEGSGHAARLGGHPVRTITKISVWAEQRATLGNDTVFDVGAGAATLDNLAHGDAGRKPILEHER